MTGQNKYDAVVAPTILVHGPPAVGPDCHCIFPDDPVSVNVTHDPEHTLVGFTLATPATGAAETVTVTVAGGIGTQPPTK